MAQRQIIYELRLVGGPHDGVKGLVWRDPGDHPVPDTILVGRCPGNGLCTASERLCRELGHGNAHPAYWLPDEDERAEETSTYEKENDYVFRDVHGAYAGIARYVVPGLRLPPAEAADERVLAHA